MKKQTIVRLAESARAMHHYRWNADMQLKLIELAWSFWSNPKNRGMGAANAVGHALDELRLKG